MPTNRPRCTITCDDELYQQIVDYRFDNRYKSESEAGLAILKLGLAKLKTMTPEEVAAWVKDTKR